MNHCDDSAVNPFLQLGHYYRKFHLDLFQGQMIGPSAGTASAWHLRLCRRGIYAFLVVVYDDSFELNLVCCCIDL